MYLDSKAVQSHLRESIFETQGGRVPEWLVGASGTVAGFTRNDGASYAKYSPKMVLVLDGGQCKWQGVYMS